MDVQPEEELQPLLHRELSQGVSHLFLRVSQEAVELHLLTHVLTLNY